MTYSLSVLAKEDLSNIWEYTAEHWSSEQADKYIREIMGAISILCANPRSGVDYSKLREGYRGFKFKSHIIFYHMGSATGLRVMRVLHQRMNIKRRLGKQ